MAKRKLSRQKKPAARLQGYLPFLEKLIFGLALLGMVTVVHLWIQEGRGFDQGCWGFNPPTASAAATFNCEAVLGSEAGTLFGVSNVALGLLFYLAIAALTAGAAFTSERTLLRLKQVRTALLAAGVLYSVFLVFYQYVELGEFCALCLTSAAIVSVLFLLQVIDYLKPLERFHVAMQSREMRREAGFFAALTVLALLLMGADVAYFENLGDPVAAPRAEALTEGPTDAGTRPVDLAQECYFHPEKDPVPNYRELVDFATPMKGNPEAPVTVIEYFDPNCPHCKYLNPVMKEVVEAYGDQARFYYKAFPIWEYSVMQVEALYAAAQEGKFFEMKDRQFDLQQQGGLSADQIMAIAREIGMNPEAMAQRMRQGFYRGPVMQDRQEAIEVGISSMPTVIINGQVIGNRSEECLAYHIEEAARQQ